MNYSITWYKNYSFVEFTGDVNIRDVELANKYVHGDKRSYKLSASIWNFAKCNSINIKSEETQYSTAVDLGSNEAIKEHKLALVTGDPNAIEAFTTYINDSIKSGSLWEFKIFNSLDDAKEWISA